MDSNRFTDESTWSRDSRFARNAHLADLEFVEPVRSFLVAHTTGAKRLIELGALPGAIGAYLASTLNTEFVGVDYVDRKDIFENTCAAFNVRKSRFICEDVFKLTLAEKFDVVASFGLVEHFADLTTLFSIHRKLCARQGLVVVTVPNFRGLARYYHFLFNRTTYKEHNLRVMKQKHMAKCASEAGLEVLLSQYVGRHRVWGINNNLFLPLKLLGVCLQCLHNYFGRHFNFTGTWFSPWLVCIGRPRFGDHEA